MAVWSGNKCGYCEATGLVGGQPRARYTCPNPNCKREGCPTCMPAGETKQCGECDYNDASVPADPRMTA